MILGITFGGVVLLLVGIFIGILFAALIGLLVMKVSINKAKKANEKEMEVESTEITKYLEVSNVISSVKDKYKEEAEKGSIEDKVNFLAKSFISYITAIASIYYPDSDKPLYELSFDEALSLLNYINIKLDKFFNKNVITRFIRTRQIKQIKNLVVNGVKLFDNKMVKTSMQVFTVVKAIINVVNPIYWSNKFMINFAFNKGENMIIDILIDVIGIEAAKVYSKSFLDGPKELNLDLGTIKDLVLEENEEE